MKILFVCLGNICRSPAAEGVLKAKLLQEKSLNHIQVASCGLGPWHVGELPDPRMRKAAQTYGIELTSRAQQFSEKFASEFDLILAADQSVLEALFSRISDYDLIKKFHLITRFHPILTNEDLADPYHGNTQAFLDVMKILDQACDGIITFLKNMPSTALPLEKISNGFYSPASSIEN
jgi:protein-tyrosine phosphatase